MQGNEGNDPSFMLRHELANIAAGVVSAKELAEVLPDASHVAKLLSMCSERMESLLKKMDSAPCERSPSSSSPIPSNHTKLNRGQTVVLVDDCEIARGTWKFALNRQGIPHAIFSSVDELLKASHLERSSPVFLDWHLGGNENGLTAAEDIHLAGFNRIYITTGNPSGCDINNSPVSGVIGKVPPVFELVSGKNATSWMI